MRHNKFLRFVGKKVKVVLKDGDTFTGELVENKHVEGWYLVIVSGGSKTCNFRSSMVESIEEVL